MTREPQAMEFAESFINRTAVGAKKCPRPNVKNGYLPQQPMLRQAATTSRLTRSIFTVFTNSFFIAISPIRVNLKWSRPTNRTSSLDVRNTGRPHVVNAREALRRRRIPSMADSTFRRRTQCIWRHFARCPLGGHTATRCAFNEVGAGKAVLFSVN